MHGSRGLRGGSLPRLTKVPNRRLKLAFIRASSSHLLNQPQGVFDSHSHPVAGRPTAAGQTEVLRSTAQLCFHLRYALTSLKPTLTSDDVFIPRTLQRSKDPRAYGSTCCPHKKGADQSFRVCSLFPPHPPDTSHGQYWGYFQSCQSSLIVLNCLG